MKHIVILLALTLLAGCAPASPTVLPTPTPQATPAPQATIAPASNQPLVSVVKVGNWKGTGEDNFTIAFTVGDGGNVITTGIEVTYKATCGARSSNITETVSPTARIAITAGEIKYTDANYTITGQAIAADRIEGTLQADGVSLGKLGQCSASKIVWSATPK